jgi:hypothetical protein
LVVFGFTEATASLFLVVFGLAEATASLFLVVFGLAEATASLFLVVFGFTEATASLFLVVGRVPATGVSLAARHSERSEVEESAARAAHGKTQNYSVDLVNRSEKLHIVLKLYTFVSYIDYTQMYKQIFIPNGQNISIPVPQQWLGRKIEVIAFPVVKDTDTEQSLAAKRKELDEILDQYLCDFSGFKFNRDEANEYD